MMIGELVRVAADRVHPCKGALGLIIDKEPAEFIEELDGVTLDQHVYTVLWSNCHVPVRIYSNDVEVIL